MRGSVFWGVVAANSTGASAGCDDDDRFDDGDNAEIVGSVGGSEEENDDTADDDTDDGSESGSHCVRLSALPSDAATTSCAVEGGTAMLAIASPVEVGYEHMVQCNILSL